MGDHLCLLITTPGRNYDSSRPRANPRHPALVATATTCSVAEILSPSNWRRTWGNRSTYRAVPRVLEILALNSVEIRATVRSRPQVSWRSRRHRDAGEHRLQRTAGRVLPDGMSERLALANAIEDAGIERGAQNTCLFSKPHPPPAGRHGGGARG